MRPGGPLAAFVFKTVSDPYVGHITMFRVFSGTVRPDASVHNATSGTDERVGQLFTLRGKEHETCPRSRPATSAPWRSSRKPTRATRSATKDDPVHDPGDRACRSRCSPTRSSRRRRATRTSCPPALARLREEDPTLRVERSDETHETVMYGMGEAHLEVAVERMRSGSSASRSSRTPPRSPTGRRSASRRRSPVAT